MLELILVLMFGEPGQPGTGWTLVEDIEEDDATPMLGVRTVFRVNDEEEDSLTAQTIYSAEREDGTHVAVMYGGPTLPPPAFLIHLEEGGWEQLEDQDEADKLLEFCLTAPPMAAVHDVLLIAGDPASNDCQIWSQTATAAHPVLPLFGHRMLLDAVDALDVEAINEEADQFDGPDYEEDLPDPTTAGSAATGLPSLVVLAETTEIGHARVGFWVSSLGDLDGFAMLANGWRLEDKREFPLKEYRFDRRVELAMATHVVWLVDDGVEAVELRIDNPEAVEPEDYELLPKGLAEFCAMRRSEPTGSEQ